ncbi:MAG: hypothetical protein GY754_43350 [bacterium]|nr:hypothetical protein [bacterium]
MGYKRVYILNNRVDTMSNERLGEFLVRHGDITEEQLNHALEEQKKAGSLLGDTLVKLGYIDEDTLLKALME